VWLVGHQKIEKSLFFPWTQGGLKRTKNAFLACFVCKTIDFFVTISTIFLYFAIYATISLFHHYFHVLSLFYATISGFYQKCDQKIRKGRDFVMAAQFFQFSNCKYKN
jgi:hypothetical protein